MSLQPVPGPTPADQAWRAARAAFAAGDVLSAVDTLQSLSSPQHTLATRQLLASSLLRAGALSQARDILRTLQDEGHVDEETLGLVAREAKARWKAGDVHALAEAQVAYQAAFERTGGTWTGVNAATLALVAGDEDLARALAQAVQERLRRMSATGSENFWHEATCAEVALLLGQVQIARAHYAAARALAPRAWGDLDAVRRNAGAILDALELPPGTLVDLFPRVSVIAFTGHTVDREGRAAPRFPAADEASVQRAIDDALADHDAVIGVAGAACGADILFLEALQRRGCDTFVVLPHAPEEFRRISVTDIGGPSWGHRFDTVLENCRDLTLLSEHPGGDLSYQFQGAVMAGLARLKASSLGGVAVGLAYWDGQAGGVGGTAMVAQEWARSGLSVRFLPFRGQAVAGTLGQPVAGGVIKGAPLRTANGQRIVAMLFADAVGFSKLSEQEVKTFVEVFWGRVGALLRTLPDHALLATNTWGDGLFLVFADAVMAARLAVDLAQLVQGTQWAALGLPQRTSLRIALHAGPVYEIVDAVTGRPGFAGTHISRAARIEPVTPPGQVYVSEAFAALLALDDAHREFFCEYLGSVPLAKDYGRLRTYRLNWRVPTAVMSTA
jgi:class 3 adenylate cyclase